MAYFLEPIIGVVLVIAGIVLCIIPGPGVPLIILGAALLAERSKPMSRVLDWSEVQLRKLIKIGLKWWRDASLPARIAAVLLAACVAAGLAYLAYRFFFQRFFT